MVKQRQIRPARKRDDDQNVENSRAFKQIRIAPPSFSSGSSSFSQAPGPVISVRDNKESDGDHGTLLAPAQHSRSLPLTPSLIASIRTLKLDQRVCFGMIDAVKCRQVVGPLPNLDPKSTSASPHVELLIRPESGRFVLSATKEAAPYAYLNRKTNQMLAELLNLPTVLVSAYSLVQELAKLSKVINVVGKQSHTFHVLLNIYGSPNDASTVGDVLSKHDLFLQDPLSLADGIAYSNPHVISFPGLSEDAIWLKSLSLSESNLTQDKGWDIVLDRLPTHHAAMVNDIVSLTLPLLEHQLDGLDYMSRRETGQLDGMSKYWSLKKHENGSEVYRHAITGVERLECPPEPSGGILADGMGLGKTLTTISLVILSLDRATTFTDAGPDEHVEKSRRVRSRATLVVAPSLLILEDWAREIERRVRPGVLRVAKYHSHERAKQFTEVQDYDIILTTYGTVTTEYRRMGVREVLYNLHFFRIVLDEAHIIRSQHTRQFEAVMMLRASHYWCLSGTPIANKVDDLGALLRFCRVSLLEDKACFREHVINVTKRSFTQGCKVLMRTLSPLCLRRTKELLHLSNPILETCQIKLSNQEKHLYGQVLASSKSAIEAIVSGTKSSIRRYTVLHAILQLRRLCNHGTLLRPRSADAEYALEADEIFSLLEENGEACCVECCSEVYMVNQLGDPSSGIVGRCKHVLCGSCLPSNLPPDGGAFHCPVCETDVSLSISGYVTSLQDAPGFDRRAGTHSTKLLRLMENLKSSKGKAKSVVFSLWKTTIDVFSAMCKTENLAHVAINGTTPQTQRRNYIERFAHDPEVSVMLMTLGTGALGLNLTAASHVHIIEPQWNPSVEEQAIGRIVRMGQENQTKVFRYIVEDTVEVQIQGYQRRKIQLAAGSFGEKAEAETEAQTRLLTVSAQEGRVRHS